jgi:PAS domain-containing protein
MSSEEAGIILTNTEGRILDCNSRCEEIAATTMEDEREGCRRGSRLF